MSRALAELAAALQRGETPPGALILKRTRLRSVAAHEDTVLKVLHARPRQAAREAGVLARARARGIAVPELVAQGEGWLATRFVAGRPAERGDLRAILPAIAQMHERGMLHRDLHLGNVRTSASGPVFLDLQKARFLPRVPQWLRRWELGYFAHSLGDPLPPELAHVASWRTLRAQRHWRSRTRRCLRESSGFTRFDCEGHRGMRRQEVAAEALARALAARESGELLKDERGVRLLRSGGWIWKRHASERAARAAWRAGHGLEVRGIATGRALAWWGPWLLMEDAGPTLSAWVDAEFAKAAPDAQREALEAAGELLGRLHARGIYHADLKANNVAWAPGRTPRLLDYGRVDFGVRVGRRRRVKNLAQLNAALPDAVPASLRELALRRYRSALGDASSDPRLREDVVRESLRRAHRWSGC